MDSDQRRIGDNVIQYKESLKVNNNITSGSKENSAIDIQNSKNSEDYDFEDYSHETMASEIRNDQNTDIDSYNTSSKKEDRQFNNKTYYLNTENNIFHQSIKDNDKSEQRLKILQCQMKISMIKIISLISPDFIIISGIWYIWMI